MTNSIRTPRITTVLGIGLSLYVIFTSSNFMLFAWKNIIGYYLFLVFASYLGGALTVEFDTSLKLHSIAFISSCIGFVLLYILSPILYGEQYPGQIDSMVAVVSTQMARTVILSFPVSIFACLLGCFSSETSK